MSSTSIRQTLCERFVQDDDLQMTKIIPASLLGRCVHGVGNPKVLPLTLPRAPLLDLIGCDLVPLQHGCQGHGYQLGVAQGPVHA